MYKGYGEWGGSARIGGHGFAIDGQDGSDQHIIHRHRADGSCCLPVDDIADPCCSRDSEPSGDLFGLYGSDDEEKEFQLKLRRRTWYFVATGLTLIAVACLGLMLVWVMIND